MDEILTIQDVARLLKLAEKTVYAMATEGELPAFKVRNQWRLRRQDFESWLAAQASGAAARTQTIGSNGATPREVTGMTVSDRPAPLSQPRAIGDLTERVPQEELHRRFVLALGTKAVRKHAPYEEKPFEIDLTPPLPHRVRLYMYNATRPPGGRPLGEHKVQLIVPGQKRSARGTFDNGDGRIVLLAGYAAEEDVFILWDAGLYTDFAWSRNVQVKAETIIEASAGKIATQERQLRPSSGRAVVETVLAAQPRRLAEAIAKRMDLTRERLLRE